MYMMMQSILGAGESPPAEIVIYPRPPAAGGQEATALSSMYAVTLNGEAAPTYVVQRGIGLQDVVGGPYFRRFRSGVNPERLPSALVSFDMGPTVNCEVVVNVTGKTIASAKVYPLEFGITPVIEGNTIRFTITEPFYYELQVAPFPTTSPDPLVIEQHKPINMSLFVHAKALEDPADVPDITSAAVQVITPGVYTTAQVNNLFNAAKSTYYFGPGVYRFGDGSDVIKVAANKTIYLAGGCVLFGRFIGSNIANPMTTRQENIRFLGRGFVDTSLSPRYPPKGGPMYFVNADFLTIRGITILDSSAWTVALGHCRDVTIEWLAIFGSRNNTDGIDMICPKRVNIRNYFACTYDDHSCIKGLGDANQLAPAGQDEVGNYTPEDNTVEDISYYRYVVCGDQGMGGTQIGSELNMPIVRRVTYEYGYYCHMTVRAAISMTPFGFAVQVSDVTYRNCVVEDFIGNDEGINQGPIKLFIESAAVGANVSNVLLENIKINKLITHTDGRQRKLILKGYNGSTRFDGVEFSNVTIAGVRLTAANFTGYFHELAGGAFQNVTDVTFT